MAVIGLKINAIVDVEYNEKSYKCTIQEINDDYIAVSLPFENGEYLVPHTNDNLVISYFDSSDVYSFSSKVIGRKRDNIPLILISIPTKVKKIQRRNYVRVSVMIVASYWNFGEGFDIRKTQKAKEETKPFKGTVLDVSGSGARILVDTKVKLNDFVLVELPLDNGVLEVHGKIVRILKDELGRDVIGLNFEDISEITRDKLIKLVFEVMRKQRRKV